MDREYDVFLNGQTVGKATLHKDGLYIRYSCLCSLPKGEIYRIVAENEKDSLNLGICVPNGDLWISTGRFSEKQMKIDGIKLIVQPCSMMKGKFTPIIDGGEFDFIEQLENAQLTFRTGKVGIIIK